MLGRKKSHIMNTRKFSKLIVLFIPFLLGCTNMKANTSEAIKSGERSSTIPSKTTESTPTPVPTCDGIKVTSGCQVNGIMYSTYIYHPEVPEKYHIETSTSTEQVLVDHCTLCVDGTWSPSCAEGRGACSYHGGVKQKKAPRYKNETKTTEKKVIDSEAIPAHYEKVTQ